MEPKFDRIVDPAAPAIVRLLAGEWSARDHLGGVVLAVLLFAVLAVVEPMAAAIGLLVALLALGFGSAAVQVGSSSVVDGVHPSFGRTPIVGVGLDYLVDISNRFAWAKRHIDELPDLVRWREIASGVEAIRHDAARHAAALTASEADWQLVVNAQPGTPQAVLRRRLEEERADRLAILTGYQHTADRLMQHAGNALAAARIAEREGRSLRITLPSPAATVARHDIEAVIDRLAALAAAWRELDSSGELLASHLGFDRLPGPGTEPMAAANRRAHQLRAAVENSIEAERGAAAVGDGGVDPSAPGQ